jgi:SAM-dependent methyltransferase
MDCDPLARWYRWLEYAGCGRALERRRFAFLPEMATARRALLLGDGDGRFLAALLRINPTVQVDAVDSSARMIALSRRRAAGSVERVRFHCSDARTISLNANAYDLIVTHFFLDCFHQEEIPLLVSRISHAGTEAAMWAVSEFRQPANGPTAWAEKGLLKGLYAFFRWTTGLQVRELPDHRTPLRRRGFVLVRDEPAHAGLLVSELWRKTPFTDSSNPQQSPGREQHHIRQDAQGLL